MSQQRRYILMAAALEDGDGSPSPPLTDEPSSNDRNATAPGSSRGLSAATGGFSTPASTRSAKGLNPIVYVLLVLIVGGAVAGAWFAGIIPH